MMQRDLHDERVHSDVVTENPRCKTTSRAIQNTRECTVGEVSEGNDFTGKTEQHGCFDAIGTPKQNAVHFSAESSRTNSSPVSGNEHNTSPLSHRLWRTRLLRLGPLSGIACLILAILSMLVSLGVLLGSNGVPVAHWTVQPSAILAICTAVANQAMRYAAFQGLMIAWWHGALRGSTIEKLHIDWRAGMTILGAVSAGRQMGLLGLACIFSTLVAVDGPLLQKATHVVRAPIETQPVSLQVSVLPELPTHFFGGYVRSNETKVPNDAYPSLVFNDTIPTADNGSIPNDIWVQMRDWIYSVQGPWLRNEAISGAIQGCPSGSQCKLKVRAPALAATACISHQIPVNYLSPASESSILTVHHAPPLDREASIIDIQLVVGKTKDKINLVTGYSRTAGCVGVLNYTVCTLEAAVADYEVKVHGDTVTSFDAKTPTIVALSNNTRSKMDWNPQYGWHPSALAGITSLAVDKWAGIAAWAFDPRTGYDGPVLYTFGAMNDVYKDFNNYNVSSNETDCVSYLNPREDVIESMNKLMFYIGYITGTRAAEPLKTWFISQLDPGLEINPSVTGHTYGYRNVYRTNLRWFAAAAGVELFCIALVLPTFIGWWRLGRPVSFSPIEIAKAFEAPLLSDCNSNSSGRDIAKATGSIRIQYGSTVDSDTRKRKLAFADPNDVQYPQQETHFEI